MTRVTLLLALAACSESADLQPAPHYTMSLQAQDSFLNPGDDLDLVVTGAPAFGTIEVALTLTGLGNGPCLNQLGGNCLDVRAPLTIIGSVDADANGKASLTDSIPVTSESGKVGVQAFVADGANSVVSNADWFTVTHCQDDASEPNEAWDSAAKLNGTRDLTLCPGGDEDWFAFDVPAGQSLSLMAMGTRSDGIYLEVTNSQGAIVASDNMEYGLASIWWDNTSGAAETVYGKFSSTRYADDGASYEAFSTVMPTP